MNPPFPQLNRRLRDLECRIELAKQKHGLSSAKMTQIRREQTINRLFNTLRRMEIDFAKSAKSISTATHDLKTACDLINRAARRYPSIIAP